MSRIGNALIQIPEGVTVGKLEGKVVVKGSKGELSMPLSLLIDIKQEDKNLSVSRKNDLKKTKAMHGLTRALIANMVNGVSNGWSKNLELVGVGFRAVLNGNQLVLTVGFSHPVYVDAPEGIQFEVRDNTKLTVSGISKELVGQVAAKIHSVKPPEPYKGKGIRYEGEYIRRKAGKAGKVGVGGAK